MAKITIFLALLSTLALLAAAEENNVLFTGDILPTDRALSTPDATFVMQDDCNLVLYGGKGFQSNTNGNGDKCTLTLNDVGQLVIKGNEGETVWNSRPSRNQGKYVAVLRPDSVVTIYGTKVFETRVFPPSTAHAIPPSTAHARVLSAAAKNLMFSGEILPTDSELSTRDYRLVMRSDCNLAIVKAGKGDIWSTRTQGLGEHCFARLGDEGMLVVADEDYQNVWSSSSWSAAGAGEFVLVLQTNGRAAIYGPSLWSTENNSVLSGFSVL